MASAKGVRAGRAFIELFLDDKISKPLNKVAKRFKATGAMIAQTGLGVTAFGTGMLAPLGIAAKLFANMGSEIFNASKRTGVAAEALSALGFAADQSGASLEDVETGLKKMSKLLSGVSESSKSAADTLADLGLSAAQFKGLAPEEQLAIFGDALSRVSDATKRSALAQEVFGKSGTNLLSTLSNGAAGLKEAAAEARRFGVIISTEDAAAADMFGNSLSLLWKQMKMVTFQTGAAVAKALQPYATAVSRIIKTVIDWVKNNGRMVVGFAAAGIAITAVGGALLGLGITIGALGFVMSGVAAGIGVIGAVLGAILTPIGLLVAGLAALGVWFVTSTTAGGNALVWLGGKFNALTTIAKEAFGGIADALAAGDIKLAADVLWAGLKVIWLQGTAELRTLWNNLWFGMRDVFDSIISGIKTKFHTTIAFMAKMTAAVLGAVQNLVPGVAKLGNAGGGGVGAAVGGVGATAAGFSEAQAERSGILGALHDVGEVADEAAAEESARRLAFMKQLAVAAAASQSAAGQELTDAQARLKQLREQAAAERDAVVDGPKLPAFDDVANAVEDVAKKIESRGTFNAAALQSLQSSPVQDRIAKAAERTARNTDKLVLSGGLA